MKNRLINRSIIHPKINSSDQKKLIAFIPERSCEDAKSEMERLNNLSKKFRIDLEVYILAKESSLLFLEQYGADFSYGRISPSDSIVEDVDVNIDTATYLVLSSNSKITQVLTFNSVRETSEEEFLAEMRII